VHPYFTQPDVQAADDLAALDALDTGARQGPEPEHVTLESYGRAIPES
jgi:hypothetical protein